MKVLITYLQVDTVARQYRACCVIYVILRATILPHASIYVIADWRSQKLLNHTGLFEMPLLNQVSYIFIIAY